LRSSGLDVNNTKLEVLDMEVGDFVVKFHVRSRSDGFSWALVAVYGAAQPELKPDFLAELAQICGSESLPMWWVVILTLSGGRKRRITIISMRDGHLCSMPLLRTWTRER
jgi:hypothetical protein